MVLLLSASSQTRISAEPEPSLFHISPKCRGSLSSSFPGSKTRGLSFVKGIRTISCNKAEENQLSAKDFFEVFLRERQYTSDFVSRASDILWRREILDTDDGKLNIAKERLAELQKIKETDVSNGFLKLSQAKQWELGIDGAPSNIISVENDTYNMQDDWRRAGFLEYEALKRELSLLTTTIAVCGCLYCGVIISFEACLSYGIGALGSLLYLKLLYHHVDNFSEDNVPRVFLHKKRKRIGIRSSDLQDAFGKTFFGSTSALLSPRLLIPVSLYTAWAFLHHFTDLELEIAPLMFGFFAYKAALLVQTYRENKELAMIFEKEENSS